MAPKFRPGQTVTMRPATSRNVPGGVYEVIQTLPDDGSDEHRYKIKSPTEPHERVARESDLAKA